MQNASGRILHMTTSRFTRTNQSRTWNTGNGSPDAICFQVDRTGISIAGVGVYGGIGHYEYELELLEDVRVFVQINVACQKLVVVVDLNAESEVVSTVPFSTYRRGVFDSPAD